MVVALLSSPLGAQSKPTAPLVLRLPGGTRAAGMGNVFVTGRGAEAIFYNPAQIGTIRGTTLSLTRFGSSATLGTFSTVGALGKIAIGAGVQYLDYETPSGIGVYGRPGFLPAGGPLQSSSLGALLAAEARIVGVRFGVAGKYVQEQIDGNRDGSFALDAGLAREVGRISVGLSVQNLGRGLDILNQRASLPTRVTLGASSPTVQLGSYLDLILAAAVSRERDGRIVPGAGAELLYQSVEGWSWVVRAGVRRVEGGARPLESPITLGGSFGLDRFWLDYAFQPSRGAGATHRIGIRIQ